MILKSSQEYAFWAIKKQKEYQILFIVNMVLAFLTFLICRRWCSMISLIIVEIVFLINIYSSYKKSREYENKVTDLSNGYIRYEDGFISCLQTAENAVYEECEIDIHDIAQIVECTTEGECGFFITLKDTVHASNIYVNKSPVERSVFYVNGFGYPTNDFRRFYHEILDHLMEGTKVTGTKSQKSWYPPSEKRELLQILAPNITFFILALVHLLLYVAQN